MLVTAATCSPRASSAGPAREDVLAGSTHSCARSGPRRKLAPETPAPAADPRHSSTEHRAGPVQTRTRRAHHAAAPSALEEAQWANIKCGCIRAEGRQACRSCAAHNPPHRTPTRGSTTVSARQWARPDLCEGSCVWRMQGKAPILRWGSNIL
jgi:hypothetical protein